MRLEWADISPYRAVLYQIEDDNPFNKKVAEVNYDRNNGMFIAQVKESDYRMRDALIGIPSKIEAMEQAMALLVVTRFEDST